MQSWGLSDLGNIRTQNQDAYQIEQFDRKTVLCIVCDGMGGAKSGNVASTLALDVFVQEIRQTRKSGMQQGKIEEMLRGALALANRTVFEQSSQVEDFAGMGTTLVAAYIEGTRAYIINVGDSRAYLLNLNGVRRITTDHSLVQMMIQRGELTAEQARSYPGKNLITRAVGTEPQVEADLFRLELQKGDGILLCTDGLTNLLDDQEILFEVIHGVNKQYCCQRLLEIAKSRGAPDNVTSVLTIL